MYATYLSLIIDIKNKLHTTEVQLLEATRCNRSKNHLQQRPSPAICRGRVAALSIARSRCRYHLRNLSSAAPGVPVGELLAVEVPLAPRPSVAIRCKLRLLSLKRRIKWRRMSRTTLSSSHCKRHRRQSSPNQSSSQVAARRL